MTSSEPPRDWPFVSGPGRSGRAVLWFPQPLGLSQHAGLWDSGAVTPALMSCPVSQVAMNILNSGRFSMGSAVAGILKKLIGG